MIKFNENDFALAEIVDKIKFPVNFDFDGKYKIFGLKNNLENTAVVLTYNPEFHDNLDSQIIKLSYFLQDNNISFVYNDDYGVNNVTIGFRRDLRENVNLCAAILNTILTINEFGTKVNNLLQIDKKLIPKLIDN